MQFLALLRRSRHFAARLSRALTLALIPVLLTSCGSETYQTRLGETVKYFDYLDKLDTNLEKNWGAPGLGVSLRVPKQFGKPLTAPKPTTDAEGNETPAVDTRQPDYINLVLPGLLGAWRGRIAVNGRNDLLPCYMYVLGNHELWQNPETREAAPEFHAHVVDILATALQIARPAPDQWTVEKFPPVNGYVASRAYQSIRLSPEAPVIENTKTTFAVYLYSAGDIQVAILLVVPSGVADREKLGERVALSLETLNVSSQMPRPPAPTASGGAPAPGAQPKRPSTPQF